MKTPEKCSLCGSPAFFTIEENRQKVPLCKYHYKIANKMVMDENKGVAM
jgi:hypothetical protein